MTRPHILTGSILVLLTSISAGADEAKPADKEQAAPKVNYADNIVSIFRAKCGSCHNANDRKGNLVLDDYAAMMEGGGSGTVVEPGDPDSSYLWSLITHESEPKMPPNQPRMPDEELALIRQWIEQGALQNAGSTAQIKDKPALAKITVTTERPAGPPPMPVAYLGEPLTITPAANAVTALAVSPWAPLAAVSGHRQIALYDTRDLTLLGVLPFPEGQPHVLRFSRNGSLLLAGGGRGGASGKVIVFDVQTGERKMEIGNEYDLVLAADISPDHSLVALGGPKKMVRIFSTVTGEQLFEMKKHTDWITAMAFSPDGVLLATGDRSNGLVVWEANTGREYLVLNGHQGSINGIAWRPDSNLLASGSEDGTVKLWELNNGGQVKNWKAHDGGVSAISYIRDGRIITAGRDKVAKMWNGEGGEIRALKGLPEMALEVAFDAETERALAGDWSGQLKVWNGADGAEIASLSSNPPTIAEQVESIRAALATAETQAKSATDTLTTRQAEMQQLLVDRQTAAQAATEKMQTAAAQLPAIEKTQAEATQLAEQRAATLAEAARLFEAAKVLYEKAQKDHQIATEGATQAQGKLAESQKMLQQLNESLAALKVEAEQAQAAAQLTAEEQQALSQAESAAQAAAEHAEQVRKALSQLEALQQQAEPSTASN